MPRVSNIPILKNGHLLARGNNYYKVSGSPYIKMNVEGKDILFKRIDYSEENKFAEYEQLSTLGNNGEYFEAFASDSINSTPQENTTTIERGTIVSDQLSYSEDNPYTERTKEEMESDLIDFVDILRADDETTAEREEYSIEEKADEIVKDLGLSEDKTKFDEMMDEFCR